MLQFYQSVRTVTALVFLCRCMFKNIFSLFEFFVGKKAKTCIKRQDNPLGTEKLLLTKMHFGSMIWMRDIGMLN